jgi:hypothetical protein
MISVTHHCILRLTLALANFGRPSGTLGLRLNLASIYEPV